MASSQVGCYYRIGTEIRRYTLFLAITVGISGIMMSLTFLIGIFNPVALFGLGIATIIITSPAILIGLYFSYKMMKTFYDVGRDKNIIQFQKFARYIFNSITLTLIGAVWVIIGGVAFFSFTFIMAMFSFYTLGISGVVFAYIGVIYSYKEWKYIDDYFTLLTDTWPKQAGKKGMERILVAQKNGLAAAIIGSACLIPYLTIIIIPLVVLCIVILVAVVNQIKGMFRIAVGFERIIEYPAVQHPNQQTNSPNQPVSQHPASQQSSQAMTATMASSYSGQSIQQPSPLRYQTNVNSPPQHQGVTRTTMQRIAQDENELMSEMARRNLAFQDKIDEEIQTNSRSTQGTSPQEPVNQQNSANAIPDEEEEAKELVTCTYCFGRFIRKGDLAKCPMCGGVLTDFIH